MIELAWGGDQVRGEIEVDFLFAKPGSRVELRELLHAAGPPAGLLLDLAGRAIRRGLPDFHAAGGNLQQLAPRRMPVLFNQRDSPVIKPRQTAGASRVPHDLSHNLHPAILYQPVPVDVKDGPAKYSL